MSGDSWGHRGHPCHTPLCPSVPPRPPRCPRRVRPLSPDCGAFPFTAAAGVPALELGFDEVGPPSVPECPQASPSVPVPPLCPPSLSSAVSPCLSLQLNPDVNVFHRKFVNEVRRCEEMDRKLRTFLLGLMWL